MDSIAFRNARLMLLVVGLALIASSVLFFLTDFRLSDMWTSAPGQEGFTELYLECHADIPTEAAAGQTVRFSFGVGNSEGRDEEYRYLVYAVSEADGARTPIDEGWIRVAAGDRRSVGVEYVFPEAGDAVTVHVELPDMGRAVHFRIGRMSEE